MGYTERILIVKGKNDTPFKLSNRISAGVSQNGQANPVIFNSPKINDSKIITKIKKNFMCSIVKSKQTF